MSKSDKESSTQDMKEASKAQVEEKANNVKKNSEDKVEVSEERKKKKKEPQLPVSESPRSITYHSSGGSFASGEVHPAAVANQIGQVETEKVEEGIVDGSSSGYLMSKKEAKLNKALLGLRIAAFVFCMFSFSLLADDKDKGPFGSASFYHFSELKFCLAANVIGFVYSGLQIYDLVKYLITKKHIVDPKLLRRFNFAMDQILTYILLSASASAVTLITRLFGAADFIEMANASVAMSLLAFKAFALAALVSGYILCRFK